VQKSTEVAMGAEFQRERVLFGRAPRVLVASSGVCELGKRVQGRSWGGEQECAECQLLQRVVRYKCTGRDIRN